MAKKFPTWIIVLAVAVGLAVLIGLWMAGTYNGLVGLDESVNEKWGNVQADYQRRADLIPNLVQTVRAYTNYEGPLLLAVTQARSSWTNAVNQRDKETAANAMDSAISRLIVAVEAYPNLKANENFLSLQDELAGTENRIKVSRVEYNAAIKSYNQRVRSFPANIVAGFFNFGTKTSFEAQAGSENAPNVGELLQ